MLEEKDFEIIEHRLDLRYKLISDCNSEMDGMRRELTSMCVDIATIKNAVDSLKWFARTTLGAVIGAIVAAIIAIAK